MTDDQHEKAQPTRGGSTGHLSERSGDEAAAEPNQAAHVPEGKPAVLAFLHPTDRRMLAELEAERAAADAALLAHIRGAARPVKQWPPHLTRPLYDAEWKLEVWLRLMFPWITFMCDGVGLHEKGDWFGAFARGILQATEPVA